MESEALSNWKFWLKVEQSVLNQKARIKWGLEGDGNTKFFHASVKQKLCHNRIEHLMNQNGQILSQPQDIEK